MSKPSAVASADSLRLKRAVEDNSAAVRRALEKSRIDPHGLNETIDDLLEGLKGEPADGNHKRA